LIKRVEEKEMTRDDVLKALAEWICKVASDKELATPEAIAALPEVAKIYLDHTYILG